MPNQSQTSTAAPSPFSTPIDTPPNTPQQERKNIAVDQLAAFLKSKI
jgi:hypothetical protein